MGEKKTCNFTKNVHILCNENKNVKDLMNVFWIGIEFTKTINRFLKYIFVDLFMTCNFKLFSYPLNLIFKILNNYFKYILNKFQNHVLICNIWKKIEKKKMLKFEFPKQFCAKRN